MTRRVPAALWFEYIKAAAKAEEAMKPKTAQPPSKRRITPLDMFLALAILVAASVYLLDAETLRWIGYTALGFLPETSLGAGYLVERRTKIFSKKIFPALAKFKSRRKKGLDHLGYWWMAE